MGIKKLYYNTYSISEFGPFGFVKMYLLIGSNCALLIDSGYGKINLKKIVEKLTDKPIILFLTHGHIDHVCGNAPFDTYLSKDDFNVYKLHTSTEFLSNYFKREIKLSDVKPFDKDIIDLGERIVRFVKTPGHTPGSICVIDEFSHMAFCGDTINPWDVWLGLDESTSVRVYRESLLKLLLELKKYNINRIHSGHNVRAMKIRKIEDFISLCNKIIVGEITGKSVNKGICKGYKAKYKTATLIWKER